MRFSTERPSKYRFATTAIFCYVVSFTGIFSLLLLSGCDKSHMQSLTVKAPELTGGKDWLNTNKPLKLSELRGKIVLLDFWNLSCVNCLHTIPILKELQARYPKELVVIGVHTPKYDNEKDTKSLQEAVERIEMEYPVVNDSDNEIWTAYGLKGYPTIVLIDPQGGLVKMMIGERSYQQLDQQVKGLIDQYKATGEIDENQLVSKNESVSKDTPLRFPEKLCIDPKRKLLFIADSGHNRIVVSTLDGKLVNLIGTGKIGATDGAYTSAEFHHPRGLAVEGNSLYVADTQNQRLRKVNLKTQVVSTISGDGQLTEILAPPDFGDAKQARLNSPWDVVVANDKLYITMAGSHQLYVLNFKNNHLYAFVGSGDEGLHDGPLLNADLAQPSGIAFGANKVYFTDSESNAVRTADIDPKLGRVKTIVGTGLYDFGDMDGSLSKAFLKHPLGVAVAGDKIYVADTLNHKIRTIDLKTKMVSTLWGSGKAGNAVGDYPQFNEPNGIALYGNNIFIADTNNNDIKVGNLTNGQVTTLAVKGLAPPLSPAH